MPPHQRLATTHAVQSEMSASAVTAGVPPASDLFERLAAAVNTLGLVLSPAQLQRLLDFLHLLQRWNKVYNLTALRDPGLMLSHHLIDCLAMLPALRVWADQQHLLSTDTAGRDGSSGQQKLQLRLLDVGSGGGLPGVVLALTQPDWQLSCVDTVAKKASFIKQAAAELRLSNLQGLHARVENLTPPPAVLPCGAAGYDLVTSRAFASLADFTRLSSHLLAPEGVWLAMKGKVPDDERADLPAGIEVFHVEQLQVPGLDAQRCLVWLRRRRP